VISIHLYYLSSASDLFQFDIENQLCWAADAIVILWAKNVMQGVQTHNKYSYLQQLHSTSEENLLSEYFKCWQTFSAGIAYMNQLYWWATEQYTLCCQFGIKCFYHLDWIMVDCIVCQLNISGNHQVLTVFSCNLLKAWLLINFHFAMCVYCLLKYAASWSSMRLLLICVALWWQNIAYVN
jgi:hypothetical protein